MGVSGSLPDLPDSTQYRSASGVVETHFSRPWLPCRGQKHLLANDDIAAAIDSHIDEAAPRLPSTNITALAMRPLTAMHTWQSPSSATVTVTPCWRRISHRWEPEMRSATKL